MTRFERIARLLSLAVVVAGCGAVTTPAPLPPAPNGDFCAAADARLRELNCPEADLREGRTFAAFCMDAVADGRDHHPECIARIRNCVELDRAATGELCQ